MGDWICGVVLIISIAGYYGHKNYIKHQETMRCIELKGEKQDGQCYWSDRKD